MLPTFICELMQISYVLPIRTDQKQLDTELTEYLRWLSRQAEVVIVDDSPAPVFAAHRQAWSFVAHHLSPDPTLRTPMGKVGSVLTGIRRAGHERIIIADDDVRYDPSSLSRMAAALGEAEVIRPQNFFDPLPWHARLDTARTLLNRISGGDWPGTLGVRRYVLEDTGGYDGSVMFENLELVRTVRAAGGREMVLLDLLVRRLPPSARQFWSQRIRQAFDEFARPPRLAVQLTLLPATIVLATRRKWGVILGGAAAAAALAEVGRRRQSGGGVYPPSASLLAPLWLAERAVCSWLAVGSRIIHGGIRYRGGVLRRAATPMRELRRRHAPHREFRGRLA